MSIRRIWSAGALLLLILGAPCALAQDFPNRPITLIMPYAPGGPGDAITRVFAGALQKNLKQQVVVDNPSGASGSTTHPRSTACRHAAPSSRALPPSLPFGPCVPRK